MGGTKRLAEAVASEMGILDPNNAEVIREAQLRLDREIDAWRNGMRRPTILFYQGFERAIEDRVDRERSGR